MESQISPLVFFPALNISYLAFILDFPLETPFSPISLMWLTFPSLAEIFIGLRILFLAPFS